MKIILALSVTVIFCEKLAMTNAKFIEKDLGQRKLQHFRAKLQIDDVTRENKTSNMHLEEIQIELRSSLKLNKNKIEKSIHMAARIKTAEINKLAKCSKKQIKSEAKRHQTDFAKFVKMSGAELQDLNAEMLKAKEITSESAERVLNLVKISVDKLKALIEQIGQDIKELAETFMDKVIKYTHECEAKIKIMLAAQEIVKSKAAAIDCADDLTKLGICSNERILEVWESNEMKIREVESSSRQCVFDLTENVKIKYQVVSSSDAGLQSYKEFMNIKISAVARDIYDKFKELLKNCLPLLHQLAKKCGAGIKELAKGESNLLKVIANHEDQGTQQKMLNIVKKLMGDLDKSNKRIFEELLKELIDGSNKIWENIQQSVADIKTCSPKQRCT